MDCQDNLLIDSLHRRLVTQLAILSQNVSFTYFTYPFHNLVRSSYFHHHHHLINCIIFITTVDIIIIIATIIISIIIIILFFIAVHKHCYRYIYWNNNSLAFIWPTMRN